MTMAWTPEMKARAKKEDKALVKVQVQLKHCGGGNFEMTGPAQRNHALLLWVIACMDDADPRIESMLDTLEVKR